MPRGDLFPEVGPYQTGYLPVGDGHVIYWEQVGNPRGRPVLFLHGGPGAGAGAVHRRFFDPAFWRVVIFDQRGAGRSTPLGSLARNTTPALIEDIEALREHLGIRQFLLFGGSWGSTLALAYAQAHPERVMGMVLRGIFLGRPSEVEWFLEGIARFFPDAHAALVNFLPEAERGDLLGSYFRRLCDPDPAIHLPAAQAWSVYEGSCSTLLPSYETVSAFAQDRTSLGLARIEAYYFLNNLFLPPDGLLAGMGRLAGVPGEIVQGRYDMICPPNSAFDLADAWPAARLTVVPDAGHSALEPGIRAALLAGLERIRNLT
ncbi:MULTISPECIES: prolyl aminopeptidase [Acidiphilium]|jgi:proline iminopeptidase|uniref:Proline iminopeptidase n=2 Tax=Acidiphilium TaxID=522 RepID=A5FXC6_ACICJ|nr:MULTISPECIES: prolyl aminopeptidase [Acidiphilium]MBU6357808.1 prolyl aminopeptidase [Rhodospirillales bacterium]ABQ30258.1 prolyl aminopeptidase, Serine peptidase, MEROPS family S33 [Acidiphilium cryptum JF-5]EGO94752.1 Proline iminopeptidase [Acidiphilium sp. PM]KDM66128.1 putative proline iminopeptidase Pip [Acidiphilium sp. JA12-A1]MBS3022317.1 prolyl aminopeptidase [Acidiphilium multivorum]